MEIDLFVLVVKPHPQIFVVKQRHRDPQADFPYPFPGTSDNQACNPSNFLGHQTNLHQEVSDGHLP